MQTNIKTIVLILISIPLSLAGMNGKRAIIIGASSGMGREVAKLLGNDGYTVGLCARRTELLTSLQQEIGENTYTQQLDVADPLARQTLSELISDMGGLDLIVISISAYLDNRNSKEAHDNLWTAPDEWASKERTLNVDAKGFIAMADVALEYFKQQNHGHLVGLSSTSGQRGVAYSPVYSAAKACISYYMEAQRNFMIQNDIDVQITDVVPGWVAIEHSPMGADPAAYWEITVQEAGKTIFEGIRAQNKVVYVPKKVWLISCLLKYLPDWMYNRYLNWI